MMMLMLFELFLAYDYYYRLRYNTAHQLLRPHLIVYLDTDADVALKKIKERNIVSPLLLFRTPFLSPSALIIYFHPQLFFSRTR